MTATPWRALQDKGGGKALLEGVGMNIGEYLTHGRRAPTNTAM
jgi:hypothetical protein